MWLRLVLTGGDEKLPLPFWQLNVWRICDEVDLDLSLPAGGCATICHRYVHPALGILLLDQVFMRRKSKSRLELSSQESFYGRRLSSLCKS
jgi:hypothetical protein